MAYVPGSVTAASVASWFGEDTSLYQGADLAWLDNLLEVVEGYVLRNYYNDEGDEAAVKQAIAIQVARAWRRRSSADGVAGLEGFTPVTFAGLDRDLAWLLRKKVVFV